MLACAFWPNSKDCETPLVNMFEHYLSYGSTDQQTVRDLAADFDGLVVPGTIAAFQAEGTKGFVLSLSARSSDPYMIDSRFPLFQNQLRSPKKSHLMLADVLGAPELVHSNQLPTPSDFTDSLVETIAQRWIEFNVGFDDVKSKTFDKYAARLNEPVLPENRLGPSAILPPYTMVGDRNDGWAGVSHRLWEASVAHATSKGVSVPLRRVIAATSAAMWDEIAATVEHRDVIAWISDLEEFRPESVAELHAYGQAIQRASQRGQHVFALYGGFFSVLLARYGLIGSSHGIGFGEHRDYIELPTSGAPPARYYVPRLHKYVPVDIAQVLWLQFPQLVACECEECHESAPASLDYHALMRHSVRARSREIAEWAALPTVNAVGRLRRDFGDFQEAVSRLVAPSNVTKRADDMYRHLQMWAGILQDLG
jgi:hypothetical protein